MKYTLYKPNSKNTGCACSLNIGSSGKDGGLSLYISVVQQYSWDSNTKKGSFSGNAKDPTKSTSVKMSMNEAGEMISAINHRIPFVAFHTSNNDSTVIKFSPWDKTKKVKEGNEDKEYITPAFGLNISKNSATTFRVPFEAGETEVLKELLAAFIRDALCAAEEAMKEQTSEQTKPATQRKQSDPEDEDDGSDVPF
jgi:hypothetical protein